MNQANETTQQTGGWNSGAVALPDGMDKRVARSLSMMTALYSFLSGSRRCGLAAPSINNPRTVFYTVVMVAQKEEVKRIRLTREANGYIMI